MELLLLVGLVNAAVGLLIGLTGVAGFLLPVFYVSVLGMDAAKAMTLSFAAFAVAGVIGSWTYKKSGDLPLKAAVPLCAGSLAGALLGVSLNAFIPARTVKLLLYLVVLASGISILVQMGSDRRKERAGTRREPSGLLEKGWLFVGLGFVTAVVCALSGAGGPILVMPLLLLLGMDVRSAVSTSMLGSVFLALPSVAGYGTRCDLPALLPLLAVCCLCLGLGVFVGSHNAHRIRQKPLKLAVGLFAVLTAVYMIVTILL